MWAWSWGYIHVNIFQTKKLFRGTNVCIHASVWFLFLFSLPQWTVKTAFYLSFSAEIVSWLKWRIYEFFAPSSYGRFYSLKLTGVRGLIFIFIVAFVHEKCKCFVLNCSVIMDTRSKQSYRKPFNSFVDFRSFRWVLQQSSVWSDTKRYNSRPFIRGVRGFFKARISICFADKFKFIELIGFFSVQSSK